ncbi:MAG: ribosome maturation factor RimM [Proteobacteria bacterium]|nr:ribosome maturation factor RimM [Pseudomonadota bacterium]
MTRQVVVGEIAGAFGVKGWVKVHSHTEPPGNILNYLPWTLVGESDSREFRVLAGRVHGGAVVAQLEGVDDRDQAVALRFRKITVSRDQFPPPEPGHYYWSDLVGLKVETLNGVALGTVAEMMATGANDVMIVRGERERLIPFVQGEFVKQVDLAAGLITVDWDPDF